MPPAAAAAAASACSNSIMIRTEHQINGTVGEYQSAMLVHSLISHRSLAQEPGEQGGQRPQQLLLHPPPITVGHHGAVAHGGAALPLHSAQRTAHSAQPTMT
jgi:hypothetical protein